MEQITILVRDKKKARSLLDLLRSLDFVSVLDVDEVDSSAEMMEHERQFFAAAGLWEGREVTTESLRSIAWPSAIVRAITSSDERTPVRRRDDELRTTIENRSSRRGAEGEPS